MLTWRLFKRRLAAHYLNSVLVRRAVELQVLNWKRLRVGVALQAALEFDIESEECGFHDAHHDVGA